MIMLGPASRARARLHGHLWFLVLKLSPHSSGRGLAPRRSSGTLQLSTRCSSLALTPSRSLAVRVGWSWLPTPSASGATSSAANPTNRRSVRHRDAEWSTQHHPTQIGHRRSFPGESSAGCLRATDAINARPRWRGVLVFEGGPSTPCELARSRPAERPLSSHPALPLAAKPRFLVRSGGSGRNFPSFSRETWSVTESDLKIGEI